MTDSPLPLEEQPKPKKITKEWLEAKYGHMPEDWGPLPLPELKRLLDAGTPRPWALSEDEIADIDGWVEPDEFRPIVHCSGGVDEWFNNSALIVAAINSLPALISAAEKAEQYREALKAIVVNGHLADAGPVVSEIARAALAGGGE